MPIPLEGIDPDLITRFRLDALPFDSRDRGLRDLLDLTGRAVLVTGGGGRGLGQAICHRVASLGAFVAIFDVDEDAALRVASELRDRWNVRTLVIGGSVDDPAAAHAAVARCVEEFGRIDTLVNNAGGVFGRQFGPFSDLRSASAMSLIERNVIGLMYCTRAALDHMLPARRGRIINVASEGGRIEMRDIGMYNACKAAVISFTRSLAHEVGPQGVSTVGVCPGVMMSDGLLALLAKPDASAATRSIATGFERTTLGRASLPEEVANVIAFLASDAGAFVHGTSVSVGGGLGD